MEYNPTPEECLEIVKRQATQSAEQGPVEEFKSNPKQVHEPNMINTF